MKTNAVRAITGGQTILGTYHGASLFLLSEADADKYDRGEYLPGKAFEDVTFKGTVVERLQPEFGAYASNNSRALREYDVPDGYVAYFSSGDAKGKRI